MAQGGLHAEEVWWVIEASLGNVILARKTAKASAINLPRIGRNMNYPKHLISSLLRIPPLRSLIVFWSLSTEGQCIVVMPLEMPLLSTVEGRRQTDRQTTPGAVKEQHSHLYLSNDFREHAPLHAFSPFQFLFFWPHPSRCLTQRAARH